MPVPRRQRAWLSTDSGAYVASVVEDGPAAKAGIQEGDVITKLDDDEITSADGLIIALRSHEVGEKVEITLMRGKDEKKVTVELGSDEELQNQRDRHRQRRYYRRAAAPVSGGAARPAGSGLRPGLLTSRIAHIEG